MLATTYNRIRPYSLYQTIAKATHSIEACVVVGGDIFGFRDIDFALGRAIERGVKFRVLFPSPKSSWMKSFTEKGNIPVEVYSEGVFRNVDSVSRLGGMARWYSAPGPCWFILIDQRLLYTKPHEHFFCIHTQYKKIDLNSLSIFLTCLMNFGKVLCQIWLRNLRKSQIHRELSAYHFHRI